MVIAGGAILFLAGRWLVWDYSNRVISVGIIGYYDSNNLPPFVSNLISTPLVTLDAHGIPQPDLAQSWQVSSDSAKYRLNLKKNMFWSDGTPLTSSDIQLNLPDVKESFPDNNTIQFSLADSYSPFFSLLTTPVFKSGTLTGIGKYKVKSLAENHNLITKIVLTDGGLTPDISVRFYPDEKTAKTAFSIGEIDSIYGISSADDFQEFPLTGFEYLPDHSQIVAIFYNLKDPTMGDKNMRHSLNCALPVITEEEQAKTSLPESSWVFNKDVKVCVDDPTSAKSYLGKVTTGKNSTVILTTTPNLASLANEVVASWKKVGISAQVQVESGQPQDFQALLISEPIPTDPDQYSLWHSTQIKTNISHYSFARMDKDLEDGRKSGDLNVRKENYADMQKTLAEDVPASFLYFPKTVIVTRLRVKDELDQILKMI